MVKWMSRVTTNRGKSLLPSTIITLAIVAMLLISGPAQAVTVLISGMQNSYTKGEDIDFQLIIELNEQDKYVPLTNISLDLIGNVTRKAVFALDGTQISGTCNIKMKPISVPNADDFGHGYGYDSGYGYNFGYGYGYGYGYGGGGGKINLIYNVTIETTCLPPGHYSVVATINTDQKITFHSTFDFELEPVETLNAEVEIKPETLNLASKGTFTAFITSDEFDIKKIDGKTIRITCDGCNIAHAVNWNAAEKKFIAKFRTKDLENVDTGDVKFIVTGKLKNGTFFEGSDTISVIDQGKDRDDNDECNCDDQNDHYDGCDDKVKEHDHKDDKVKEHDDEDDKVKKDDHKEKKVKDQKQDKNKNDDQKNNYKGVKGKTVVVNNIYINDNSGTVNVNIYNQGGGSQVNQENNNNNKKNDNGNKEANQGNNNQKGNNGKGKK